MLLGAGFLQEKQRTICFWFHCEVHWIHHNVWGNHQHAFSDLPFHFKLQIVQFSLKHMTMFLFAPFLNPCKSKKSMKTSYHLVKSQTAPDGNCQSHTVTIT